MLETCENSQSHTLDEKNKLKWFKSTNRYRELDGIDGVRVDDVLSTHDAADSPRNPKLMRKLGCEPEQFQGRLIFTSMYDDIECNKSKTKNVYVQQMHKVWEHTRKRLVLVIGYSSNQVEKQNGMRQALSDLAEMGQSCRCHDEFQRKCSTLISWWEIIHSHLHG